MIITKLIGGLGNQMFQYAVGRRAAYVNNAELKLDITGYERQAGITPRKYVLNIFNIQTDVANNEEISKLKKENILFNKLNKIIPVFKNSYIKEKYFYFNQDILNIKDNSYLEGYWASEKYFKDIENIIRKEFNFKNEPDGKNKAIIYRIINSNSIAVHIRRGDYVNDTKTNKRYGVCSLNYYKKAINIMLNKISNPNFFIFSDDFDRVKKNLSPKRNTYIINWNSGKIDYEDLRLMSLCKHNIIANSSFGWWGAWLNKNKNKIVITPKKWFRDPSINTKDLIPKSWIKI